MSTAQPFTERLIGRVHPTERATFFAGSVRARSARALGPRRSIRPSRMYGVLLQPLPPLVRHHWHRTETQGPYARLSLALSFPMAMHVPPTGNERHLIDGGQATRRTAPRFLSLVQRVVHFSAAPPLSDSRTPHRAEARRGAATGVSAPSLVAMVQGRPEGPAPDPAPGAASALMPPQAAASNAVRAYWGDSAPTAERHSSGALTSRDLPVVVDHVVREIDRRFTAARERKGWVG